MAGRVNPPSRTGADRGATPERSPPACRSAAPFPPCGATTPRQQARPGPACAYGPNVTGAVCGADPGPLLRRDRVVPHQPLVAVVPAERPSRHLPQARRTEDWERPPRTSPPPDRSVRFAGTGVAALTDKQLHLLLGHRIADLPSRDRRGRSRANAPALRPSPRITTPTRPAAAPSHHAPRPAGSGTCTHSPGPACATSSHSPKADQQLPGDSPGRPSALGVSSSAVRLLEAHGVELLASRVGRQLTGCQTCVSIGVGLRQ